MVKIALRNALAGVGRLLLTSIAVIAGCAFLSGVFVFSDTIRASFDRLFANAFEGTDAFVRSTNVIEGEFGAESRDRLPASLIAEIDGLAGIAEAVGDVQGFARVANAEGEVVGIDGPPKFGAAYTEGRSSPWKLVEGRRPSTPGEVVIDKLSADQGRIGVGETVTVTARTGARHFTVVGVVRFGDADTSGAANWALFDLPTAQEFVIGREGVVDSISVVGDGSASDGVLAARIEAAIRERMLAEGGDPEVEVLTGAEITAENQSDIEEGLSFFTIFLTIFAAISLFVGSFIIFNVFSISAAQRTREHALLRAIGARRAQVTKMMFVEALAIGLLGGGSGFFGGVALATLTLEVLRATGFGPTDTSLVVQPGVFVVSVIVGVVVTVACAIVPAVRSGRVPPVAAMREVQIDRSDISRTRLVLGVIVVMIAAAGTWLGLTVDPWWLGPGVVALFVSLVVLGPLFVAPIARWLTVPLGMLRGVTGEIAGRSAATNPKRTALTAGALGIGLALLIAVATLGASVRSSIRASIGERFAGDFIVSTADDDGFGGLPTTLADELNRRAEVGQAVGIGMSLLSLVENGEPSGKSVLTTDPLRAPALLDLTFVSGGWTDLDSRSILVSTDKAARDGLTAGDGVEVVFLDGSTTTLAVGGLFESDDFGNLIVSRELFAGRAGDVFDVRILVSRADGVSTADALAGIREVADRYPTSTVQTRADFIDEQSGEVDGFINFIYALLLMSVFIAILGIVITLLLSVHERRRELGMMRAVGMTRQQMRAGIRWEALITAVLGALMGTALGLALGWIVVRALRDDGLNTFSVSIRSIVVFVAVSMSVAVIAAWLPARRAAKADVLQAIATM